MYSQCPSCRTIYRLDAATLSAARGRVRCGTCAQEFDALATLVESLPADIAHLEAHDTGAAAPTLALPAMRPTNTDQRDLFVESRKQPPVRPPSFARSARRGVPRPHSGRWAFACLVLLLALGAQAAWAGRERLLAEPLVRDLADRACLRLGCELTQTRDASAFGVLARDVRPHPSVPKALIISATVSNQAAHAQPYPTVVIVLSDADQNRIAMRRFRPGEYVSELDALRRGMGPGSALELHFEVADPGKTAVAFEFSFL